MWPSNFFTWCTWCLNQKSSSNNHHVWCVVIGRMRLLCCSWCHSVAIVSLLSLTMWSWPYHNLWWHLIRIVFERWLRLTNIDLSRLTGFSPDWYLVWRVRANWWLYLNDTNHWIALEPILHDLHDLTYPLRKGTKVAVTGYHTFCALYTVHILELTSPLTCPDRGTRHDLSCLKRLRLTLDLYLSIIMAWTLHQQQHLHWVAW